MLRRASRIFALAKRRSSSFSFNALIEESSPSAPASPEAMGIEAIEGHSSSAVQLFFHLPLPPKAFGAGLAKSQRSGQTAVLVENEPRLDIRAEAAANVKGHALRSAEDGDGLAVVRLAIVQQGDKGRGLLQDLPKGLGLLLHSFLFQERDLSGRGERSSRAALILAREGGISGCRRRRCPNVLRAHARRTRTERACVRAREASDPARPQRRRRAKPYQLPCQASFIATAKLLHSDQVNCREVNTIAQDIFRYQ
jgi:hypothetical protein